MSPQYHVDEGLYLCVTCTLFFATMLYRPAIIKCSEVKERMKNIICIHIIQTLIVLLMSSTLDFKCPSLSIKQNI